MKANFSTLAHNVRRQLAAAGVSLSLGHAQQLLAASLGYGSLAAYQASPEEKPGIQGCDYVILDVLGVISRAGQLAVAARQKQLLEAIVGAIEVDPEPPAVFLSDRDFVETEVARFAEESILDDDAVASAAANTNAYFDDVEIEIGQPDVSLAQSPEFWEVPINGRVHMDQDPDKPFSGDTINTSGVVRVWKAGRVCLMNDMELDVGASVDDGYYERDDVLSDLSISPHS